MIGLVFVSHSDKLAQGMKELSAQMTQGLVKISAAGGRPDGGLGTDVERITAAIRDVQSDGGVLVLMDLGSAVMSAEMAVETLDGECGVIKLSNASFVEGGIVAAVEASIGKSLEDTEASALSAAGMRKVEK